MRNENNRCDKKSSIIAHKTTHKKHTHFMFHGKNSVTENKQKKTLGDHKSVCL